MDRSDRAKAANMCACGFEVGEFTHALTSIENRIGEVRVYESKLSPDLIRLHQQVAGHTLDHLHNVRDLCGIDTTEEEKRLIKLQANLQYVNIQEKRNELADDTAFVMIGIREKLYRCSKEK